MEVAVLGRGQFVGERAVINDKLRSADCVAQGQVQVVVLKKREFMDLDNPLLAWMLDYDAVSAVIRVGGGRGGGKELPEREKAVRKEKQGKLGARTAGDGAGLGRLVV